MPGRQIGNKSVITLGETGLVMMSALQDIEGPVYGPVTGFAYPFNTKKTMYVDRRDAVFLLGEELDIVL